MSIASAGAARRTQGVSAFSFDVFDTFLLRACTSPDGVFERTYELAGLSETHPNASENFVQHRIQAEARARRLAREQLGKEQLGKEQPGSAEICINDIYARFPFGLFGLHRDRLDDLAAAEFRAELDLCRADPEMLQHYSELKGAGHHVGFIADTYWTPDQLSQLLRACAPDLTWDFLCASGDHGRSKSKELLATYLAEQGIDAATTFHVGAHDRAHVGADVRGVRRHGTNARHAAHTSPNFTFKLHRETAIFELLCPARPSRLDHGARTLRRMVAAQSAETSAGFQIGVTVVGPVLAAFDAFIEQRRAWLAREGSRVAVGFLGRDGFLSHRIWCDMRSDAAAYIEINRRVSLLGAADTLEPLAELLRGMAKIDEPTFIDIVKLHSPKVTRFFARYPDGITTGAEFAGALPDVLDAEDVAGIAGGLRKRLLAYLRLSIPGFDSCTDLVLADLGYSAGAQKALRRIFDIEGLKIRLHGAYLLSLDDAFSDIDNGDSAAGLISDLVVTPHVKQMLIRNIAPMEQICRPGDGSARDYRGAEVLRDVRTRPAKQAALAGEIQSGVLTFVTKAREIASRCNLQPYATLNVAARWTAASLARLLLLPGDDELALLGTFAQAIGPDTQPPARMLDGALVRNQIIARGLSAACAGPTPPTWLAGSFATLSPSHAYLYALFGASRLPSDIFGETAAGRLQVGLFQANGSASVEAITVLRAGTGDVRLRIPITRAMAVTTIGLPLGRIAREGVLEGIVIQTGHTVAAAANAKPIRIDEGRLVFAAGIEGNGRHYRALDDDGCLMIPIDRFEHDVAIYTIVLRSLSGASVTADHGDNSGSGER